jgi:hypothetical protein
MTRWRLIIGALAALPLAACAVGAPAGSPGTAAVSPGAPAGSHRALAASRGTPAASPGGLVTGTLRLEGGPMRPGGQQPGKRPIPGTIQFARGGHRLISTRTGHSGAFSIRLPAGTYRVSGGSPRVTAANGTGRETACSQSVTVTVTPGHTLHISLVCIVP